VCQREDASQKRIENVLILRLRKHEEAAMQCRYVPAFELTVTKEDRTIQEPYYKFLCDFWKRHIIGDKQRHVNQQCNVSPSLARRLFSNVNSFQVYKTAMNLRQEVNAFLHHMQLLIHMTGGSLHAGLSCWHYPRMTKKNVMFQTSILRTLLCTF
jgi:hypothetical protein